MFEPRDDDPPPLPWRLRLLLALVGAIGVKLMLLDGA